MQTRVHVEGWVWKGRTGSAEAIVSVTLGRLTSEITASVLLEIIMGFRDGV